MRLVFMGTSEFAVPALTQLHSSPHNILTVVTQPDRPKGRGRKQSASPIKTTAIKLGYKVEQPSKVNDNNFINKIKLLEPDLLIVLAFGQILCDNLLNIPKKGAINVHPSIIPKYRGPAPIQWAIINGDSETGVTTMLMNSGIDTGSILLSTITKIEPYETTISLQNRLSNIGSKLLIKTLYKIEKGLLTPIKQNYKYATIAPILRKKDGLINWNSPAKKIDAFIRGMNPWPGAFTFYKNNRLKILNASVININYEEIPGTIINSSKGKLWIATSKDAIFVEKIQSDSGKKIPIDAFLCGHSLPKGSILKSAVKVKT